MLDLEVSTIVNVLYFFISGVFKVVFQASGSLEDHRQCERFVARGLM